MGKIQATKSNFPKGKCKAIILLEATVFALSTAEYDSCSQSVYVVDIFSHQLRKTVVLVTLQWGTWGDLLLRAAMYNSR